MKKGTILALSLALLVAQTPAQQSAQQLHTEMQKLRELPELTLPASHRMKSLPTSLDLSATPYFPEVFNQYGWSCNQASTIGYILTYELNARRERPATTPENLYPPLFVWNFLNDAHAENGVSFFDSWEIVRMNGIPNYADYGWNNNDEYRWMTGYDKYYAGMHNRISRMYSIKTDTEEGILTLKHWLKDRLNGSRHGSLANFQIGSTGMRMQMIPEGEPGAGSYLMTSYAFFVGHAMTVIGWDDQVRWDVNGDGQYTNDVDINGDGLTDIRDHEVGAFLVLNSWGSGWGDKGRVYVPYRLFALEPADGGIWEQCVTVVDVLPDYEPKLTYKVGLSYTKRTQLKIIAGVAQNVSADRPDHVIEYPFFNYLGGYMPMQGVDDVGSEFMEFGLDVSPLLAYVQPGQQAKFFLEVYQRQFDEAAGQGKVDYFSVMDYGLEQVVETASPITDQAIGIETVTRVFAYHIPRSTMPRITQETLPQAQVGTGYLQTLTANGGTPPYTFGHGHGQYQAHERKEAWSWPAGMEKVLGISDTSRMLVDLGFTFPFYGQEFNQVILLKNGGLLMGDHPADYPYVIDPRLYTFQNAGIFPLYGALEYGFIGDGVYRLDTEDGVIFAWDVTLSKYAGFYDLKFGVRLHENGHFSFGFNRVALISEWDWISVVSAGDQVHYTLTGMNTEGIWRGDVSYDFRYFEWPEWLFMTPTGSLLGTPPATAVSQWIPLTVRDANFLSTTRLLFLDVAGGMGMEDALNNSGFRMYPNPASSDLFIETDPVSGERNIRILNGNGQEVRRQVVAPGERHSRIAVRELEAGVYFVILGNAVQKLVIH